MTRFDCIMETLTTVVSTLLALIVAAFLFFAAGMMGSLVTIFMQVFVTSQKETPMTAIAVVAIVYGATVSAHFFRNFCWYGWKVAEGANPWYLTGRKSEDMDVLDVLFVACGVIAMEAVVIFMVCFLTSPWHPMNTYVTQGLFAIFTVANVLALIMVGWRKATWVALTFCFTSEPPPYFPGRPYTSMPQPYGSDTNAF